MRRHMREAHIRIEESVSSDFAGQGDTGVALEVGRQVLELRAENIRDLTNFLVDDLRECGASEARIRKVQHIMSGKIVTPTASAPSSTPLSPTSLALGESASDASTVNQSPQAGTFMPTSNHPSPATPAQAATTFDILPGSSSASSPTSISVSTPSGSFSSLNQVLSGDSENVQIVNLEKGNHVVKLPAHQSYLLIPVQPKVTVQTRGLKRSAAAPPQQDTPSKFRCEPCDKSFRDNFNLKDHCKKVHGERADSLACERYFCSRIFSTLKEKKDHMTTFWKCPEVDCARKGLKWRREVSLHKQFHSRQKEKLARIAHYLSRTDETVRPDFAAQPSV